MTPGIVPGTVRYLENRRSIITPPDFVYLLDRAPESIFFRITKQMLPGWWREIKGIVGMTKFTKLGLTIRNTIGKFWEGSLGNDSSRMLYNCGNWQPYNIWKGRAIKTLPLLYVCIILQGYRHTRPFTPWAARPTPL